MSLDIIDPLRVVNDCTIGDLVVKERVAKPKISPNHAMPATGFSAQLLRMKCRLLLPGACEPRLTLLKRKGLSFGDLDCVKQLKPLPEHGCHLQLYVLDR